MYCRNCGMQNPDANRFCSGCGQAMTVQPVQHTAPPQRAVPVGQQAPMHQAPSVQKSAPSKKKAGAVQRILISLVVFAVVFAASYVATTWENNNLPDVTVSSGAASTAYYNLFWDMGINCPDSDFAGQGLNTVSYAIANSDGLVESLEYVFEDGKVLSFIDTIFVPVYNVDEGSRAVLDLNMRTTFMGYTALSFCQLSSYEDNGYYVYKLIFTDLDKKENVRQLTSLQSGGEEIAEYLSIKKTEENHLANGYVKR